MTSTTLRTHVSIDTADLSASIAFYRALLGAEPTLERHDYARFQGEHPPLVLGLNAVRGSLASPTGPLEHLGIQYPDPAALADARRRLEGLRAAMAHEEDTECCYAQLTRSWATDPSGVRWELFHALQEVTDAPTRGGRASACCEPACCTTTA
jgi:catechol 2,3-dioxygenase-like lactoylglutathione lyase family enzyme